MQMKLSRMGDGDPEVLNSQGLAGHSLVQFWMGTWDCELTLDPIKFYIIGCDEEDTTNLLRYRTHFAGSTIRPYRDDLPDREKVISRVFRRNSSEMSPNICYYSEDEYPHTDFALSCGIRASFCFGFPDPSHFTHGVLEIVSTRNQDVGVVRKYCESFEEFDWSVGFQSNTGPEYGIPELDRLLELVCQTFHLPLTQYWTRNIFLRLVHQFSYRDYENLAPWCQFKDACLHKRCGLYEGALGNSCESSVAFFCKDITALSITEYPFAHYAQNCGSIACFTIYLKQYILEFFLPSQEMDNVYTQTLLNSIWAKLKESLPNCELASGEQLGQVLSVKVINSSTQTEPEFFEIGQPQSTLPHHELINCLKLSSNCHTRTLKLFENGPDDDSSNSNSYEEAATGETSKRIPSEASQPRRSEEYFKTKGNTVAAERVDEPVEESTIEEAPYATSNVDVGCATTNVDIRNAMTTASQPSRFQTMTKPCQQQEETMILGNEGDTSQQLPRILQPLFEDGIEQDEQVLQMKRSTPNIYSCEEMSTASTSKRSPEYIEQIISLDELDEELPSKCNEPQSLTSQTRRSEEIFGDEGYTVASERVNEQVEKSLVSDKDVGYAMNIASQPFISGTMTSVPQQEFHKEIMVSENSVLLEDDTTIHFVGKTSTEAHTSKGERISEEDISFESVSKHLGRPLDDAAKSFGVSRSTFKRICRDLGIKRWQYGKRRMDGDLPSKLTRRLKNEEPSRRNFSYSGVTPVHDTVVSRTGQDLNEMTVKVTYNGINIRFKLPDLSGIAELENNVIERLHLEKKSFSIKYQDDEGDWVLIACDKDLWECMDISRSLKKTTIKLSLDPPIHHHAS